MHTLKFLTLITLFAFLACKSKFAKFEGIHGYWKNVGYADAVKYNQEPDNIEIFNYTTIDAADADAGALYITDDNMVMDCDLINGRDTYELSGADSIGEYVLLPMGSSAYFDLITKEDSLIWISYVVNASDEMEGRVAFFVRCDKKCAKGYEKAGCF